MLATNALQMVRQYNPNARFFSVVYNDDGSFNGQILTGLPTNSMLAIHDGEVLNTELEKVMFELDAQNKQTSPQTPSQTSPQTSPQLSSV